jgi:glucokinase
MFASLLGSEAGNLALKALPYGGVFLSGGIAPKIKEIFKEPFFLDRFLNKGRLRPVLEKIPVYLITNSGYGVIGAINFALLK